MKIERVEIGNIEVKLKTESLERATPDEEKSEGGNGQSTTPSIPQCSRSSSLYQERADISGGSLNGTKPKNHRKTRSELWKYFDHVFDAPQKCGKCHICGTIVPADSKRHGTKMLEFHYRKCSKSGGVVVTQNRAVTNDLAQRHENDLKYKPKYYKGTRSKLWTYFERVLDAPQTCGKCHVCGTIVPADNQKHGTKMLELHHRKCTKAHAAQIQAAAPQENKAPETAPPGFKVKPNDDDIVDFRGLARIPRRHASLLEEECLQNPSLAECEGTSARWRQFVYETVGELLHFMRTTRRADMVSQEKRARLRQLWDEARGAAGPARVSSLEASVGSALEELEEEMGRLDRDHDALRCQLATLMRLMGENELARASLEARIQTGKSDEEAFLW